jgi:hypothetical protein
VALSDIDARQLAVQLQRLDHDCLELVGAAINRLARDPDGSFRTGLEELYQRSFASEQERLEALYSLIAERR